MKMAIPAILALMLLSFGCLGLGQDEMSYPSAGGLLDNKVVSSTSPSMGGGSYSQETAQSGSMVIKTGNINVLVQSGTIESKYMELRAIINSRNADISGVSYNEYSDQKGYTLTIKVQPKDFESVLADLKKLGEVKSADTNLEDVTTEYTDLEVRVSNLKKEMLALNELYSRTENIEDILKIRSEISNVQTQLELYEKQMLDIERRVAKSTISIYMYEEKAPIDKNLLIPLGEMGGVFFGALGFGITLVVGALGFLLPGLVLLLVAYLGWKVFKGKK